MFQKQEEQPTDSPQHYMRIYIGLSLIYVLVIAFRGIAFRISTITAARRVYDRLSAMVYVLSTASLSSQLNLCSDSMGAEMRFFDTTPVGQVVNRMSRDTKVVDSEIGKNLNYLYVDPSLMLALR